MIDPWKTFSDWVDSLSRPFTNVADRWVKKLQRSNGTRKW